MMQAIAKEALEDESSAYFCSSRILDDGIIDPRDSRYDFRHNQTETRKKKNKRKRQLLMFSLVF